MFPEVLITSREDAGRVLMSRSQASDVRYVVSIGEIDAKLPAGLIRFPRGRRIRLEFDDVEQNHTWYIGCNQDEAATLVRFCQRIASKPGQTLIHCAAGQRRSSAAAVVLFAACLGVGQEEVAVEAVCRAREWSVARKVRHADTPIQPNRRIVYLCDQILGHNGALLAAVERRSEFAYSRPFDPNWVA